jgi:hypothetical protein
MDMNKFWCEEAGQEETGALTLNVKRFQEKK